MSGVKGVREMRRTITLFAVAAFAATMFSVSPASAAACPYSTTGSFTSIANGTATNGAVSDGQVAKYKVTVPSGTTGNVVLQMVNGDVDLTICKGSDFYCISYNGPEIADSCGITYRDGLTNEQGQLLVIPRPHAGRPLDESGQYEIFVNHCFSSVDGDAGCDYTAKDPVFGNQLAPGATNGLPPIHYVIGFAAL